MNEIGMYIAIVRVNHNAGGSTMYSNVNTHEQIIRPIISILIAVAVLRLPQIPPWVALLSVYPFFTALIGWDPFYAVFNALRAKQDTHVVAQRLSHGVTG